MRASRLSSGRGSAFASGALRAANVSLRSPIGRQSCANLRALFACGCSVGQHKESMRATPSFRNRSFNLWSNLWLAFGRRLTRHRRRRHKLFLLELRDARIRFHLDWLGRCDRHIIILALAIPSRCFALRTAQRYPFPSTLLARTNLHRSCFNHLAPLVQYKACFSPFVQVYLHHSCDFT